MEPSYDQMKNKVLLPRMQPLWLASIVSFMQRKTHCLKQPSAPIKAFCPAFNSLHGNHAAALKHRRQPTKEEADCPSPTHFPHPTSRPPWNSHAAEPCRVYPKCYSQHAIIFVLVELNLQTAGTCWMYQSVIKEVNNKGQLSAHRAGACCSMGMMKRLKAAGFVTARGMFTLHLRWGSTCRTSRHLIKATRLNTPGHVSSWRGALCQLGTHLFIYR